MKKHSEVAAQTTAKRKETAHFAKSVAKYMDGAIFCGAVAALVKETQGESLVK